MKLPTMLALALVTASCAATDIGANSLTMSASEGRTDFPFKWGHFRF